MKIELTESFDKALHNYLVKNELINESDVTKSYAKAGEGNMNFVMRLTTNNSSLILKQSRDYVNKYPQIAAPIERIAVEKRFFEEVATNKFLSKVSPAVVFYDDKNHLLIMEDLGKGKDYMFLYDPNENTLNESETGLLIAYLVNLHSLNPSGFPDNQAMKLLNHEHIFHFPFMVENGFNLDDIQEGLQALALEFKNDELLKETISTVGARYLKNGSTLLHGDFYPGSWLNVDGEVKVIDPEFGFMGDPEFDLGVMLAHLSIAKAPTQVLEKCIIKYQSEKKLDLKLLRQYQGIEVMRRLIGIAQLPLQLGLDEKKALLVHAKSLIC